MQKVRVSIKDGNTIIDEIYLEFKTGGWSKQFLDGAIYEFVQNFEIEYKELNYEITHLI